MWFSSQSALFLQTADGAHGHPTEQTAGEQIPRQLSYRCSPFLLTSPLKQTSSPLPGLPFSTPVSSHCTCLCVITSLKNKRMQVNSACLSLFFLPHWLAFYWFPCPRSPVETRSLCSRSCLFGFSSHLATESLREVSQTIATYTHLYHVAEVFPATQPSLSFHPGALIVKVEKVAAPCLLPLGKRGLWKSYCSVFSLVLSLQLDFFVLKGANVEKEGARSQLAAFECYLSTWAGWH